MNILGMHYYYDTPYPFNCHICNEVTRLKVCRAFIKTECNVCLNETDLIAIFKCGHYVCCRCSKKTIEPRITLEYDTSCFSFNCLWYCVRR